jgi:hypothetical protein
MAQDCDQAKELEEALTACKEKDFSHADIAVKIKDHKDRK